VITDHLHFPIGGIDLEMPGEMRAETQAVEKPASAQYSIMPGAGSAISAGLGGSLTTRSPPPVLRAAALREKWPDSSPGVALAARIVALGGATGLLVDAGRDHHAQAADAAPISPSRGLA
jgi:hypothetical protein